MSGYVNAIIIPDLIPDIEGIEALAVSDGSTVLLTLRQAASGEKIKSVTLAEIVLDKETIERLLALIDDPS